MGEKLVAGILTLVCEETSEEISSGAVYTKKDLDRTRGAKVEAHCPFCGKSHVFCFSDAVLRPLHD